MALENPLWGEERIANELLLKLAIRVSPRTVRKYMPRQYGRLVEAGWPVSGDVGCAASRAELHAENESSATNKETGHG